MEKRPSDVSKDGPMIMPKDSFSERHDTDSKMDTIIDTQGSTKDKKSSGVDGKAKIQKASGQ